MTRNFSWDKEAQAIMLKSSMNDPKSTSKGEFPEYLHP